MMLTNKTKTMNMSMTAPSEPWIQSCCMKKTNNQNNKQKLASGRNVATHVTDHKKRERGEKGDAEKPGLATRIP